MNLHRPRGVQAFLALALACGSAAGCSFLLHSDASQCSSDSDCMARGPAFEGTTCEVTTGTCVSSNLGDGGGGGGEGGHGDSGNEGGKGEGGKPAIPCKKYSDCPAQTATQDFACDIDIDNGTCVNLYSTDCPFVIGDVTNDNAPPIFIGAFATFPASGNTEGHPSFLNYAEAINELGNNGDGIQIGSALRTP